MRLFEVFEADNNPSDDDLFGNSEMDKIRLAFIDELEKDLERYRGSEDQWVSARDYRDAYRALETTLNAFQTKGLIAGLQSLSLLTYPMIGHLDNELSYNHRIILGQVKEKYLKGNRTAQPFQDVYLRENEPTDDDLFGEDKSEQIRRGIIAELNNFISIYHETPWLHRNQSVERTRAEVAALGNVRDTFINGGLINGLRSLDNPDLSHNIIDYLDYHLAEKYKIDLGKVEEKYLGLNENDSDDDLFGASDDRDRSKLFGYAKQWFNAEDYRQKQQAENNIAQLGYAIDYADDGVAVWYNRDNSQGEDYNLIFFTQDQLDGQSLDEDVPTDDDLFGGNDSSSHGKKIADIIYDYAKEGEEWANEALRTGVFTPEEVQEVREENARMFKVATLFRTTTIRIAMREFMKLWETSRSDIRQMAHYEGMDWIDEYIKAYGELTNEATEPTDDDLFGDQSSLIRNRIIAAINELQVYRREKFYEILGAMGVTSISDIDADDEANWDVLDEIEELNQHADIYERFIREFNTGLKEGLEYFANSMSYALGGAHYEVAEFIEYHVLEKFGTNLRDLTKQVLGLDIE